MKLSDLIDHIEYVSDDNGSISHAEIRETSEDGKIVDVYCRSRRTLYNYLFVSDDHEESIDEILTDVPCRIKIQLDDVDVSSGTCSFTCDLYKCQVFIEEMSSGRKLMRQIELQIQSDLESDKLDFLYALEIRPVLKTLE